MVLKVDDYLFPPDEIIDYGPLTDSDVLKLRLKGVRQIESWLPTVRWQFFKDVVCKARGHIFSYINGKHKFAVCNTCKRVIKVQIVWHPYKERDYAPYEIERYKLTNKRGREGKTRVYMYSSRQD